MHLEIKQANDRTEQVGSTCIDKLYNLSKNGLLDATSDLRGSINAASAYEDAVTFLNTMWGPDLIVTASAYYIRFADPEVESVLKTALNKAEGEGITTQEAAATNLGTIFRNNADIESFDEFTYFTRANNSPTTDMFYGCTELTRLNISELRAFPSQIFMYCHKLSYFNGTGSEQGTAIISEGTTTMSFKAFNECNCLTKIYLPDTLTSLGRNVFDNCIGLQEVYFGNSINSVGSGCFLKCAALNKVVTHSLEVWLNITWGNLESNPVSFAHKLYVNDTLVTSVDFTGKTTIKSYVFAGLTSLTTITIPENMTSIGNGAFYSCSGLTSVTIPNSVTSIGSDAFRSCDNLTIVDLNLPNLSTLGSYAFMGTKLQAISSLGSIASLSQGCFRDCTQLANAIIPSTTTVIPGECFFNCLALTSVDLPSSVTTIEQNAFCDCRNLTTIDLTNITTLGDMAFARCGSLSRFNGPNSTVGEIYLPNLTGDMHNAFRNLSQYASAQIIYNITSLGTITVIGQLCFSLMRIESIHLPATLTKIGSNAFTNCPYVHDIYWEGTMDQWVNIDFEGGGANPCSRSSVNFYVNGAAPPSSYTFPSGTTEIKKFVFDGLKGLTSVTIPNSVTSISQNAFSGCSDLTSVTINAVSPPILGANVFSNTNNCPIYVPAGSVSAYQSASNWSTYASRIQAIPTT